MEFKNEKVCVSHTNSKLGGHVASVSLPYIMTCTREDGSLPPCAVSYISDPKTGERIMKTMCYCATMQKSAKDSWLRNYTLYVSDRNEFWKQLRAYMAFEKYFRYFVSGDIPDPDFLNRMVETANMFPDTTFLFFTKKHYYVNRWCDSNGVENWPENLHCVMSGWGKEFQIDNPYHFPESNVIPIGGKTPTGAYKCGGSCEECLCAGTTIVAIVGL